MLDSFYYENSRGQRVEFGKGGVFANYNDLRDYAWEYTSLNGIISKFDRTGIVTKSLPVVIIGDDAKTKRNTMHSIFETDISLTEKGRIYVGDFYLNCWVYASQNSEYLSKWKLKTSLSIVTDDPFWHQDKKFSFVVGDNEPSPEDEYLDYSYDYPYDFTISKRVKSSITNDSAVSSDFEIIIYGGAVNPSVSIGDYSYGITGEILSGEYLKIDSFAKTITKVKNNGQVINVFDMRNRNNYIFEPIKSGKQTVLWQGGFGWDITLHKKWSEPKWI